MIQKYLLIGAGSLLALGAAGYTGYSHGYNVAENKVTVAWQKEKIKQDQEMEKAMGVIEAQHLELSDKVRVQYVDQVDTVTKTVVQNRDVIKEVFKTSPFIPRGWVYAHDQLVDGEFIDPQLASSLEPSEFTYGAALDVIADNYGVAIQGKIKDETWNQFYTGVLRSYDDYRLPAGTSSSSDDSDSSGSSN